MWIKDPISLLRFEHSIIRVRSSLALASLDWEIGWIMLKDLYTFVTEWHAKIEDIYVFPLLGVQSKPFSNDHLLLEKYGKSCLNERRRDWAERFISILIEHNINEERNLFPDEMDAPITMQRIVANAKEYKDYFAMTGLEP
ncbi:hypothetical protein HS7_12390 [Sulfolobales archaeon HS-7]|nr:hypothetical protein HS7_12390 [Sulfolobales archaeon HS-7]